MAVGGPREQDSRAGCMAGGRALQAALRAALRHTRTGWHIKRPGLTTSLVITALRAAPPLVKRAEQVVRLLHFAEAGGVGLLSWLKLVRVVLEGQGPVRLLHLKA